MIKKGISEEEAVNDIKDIVRYTSVSDSNNLTNICFNILYKLHENRYNIINVKNTWVNEDNPYKGINILIESPDGQKFELQFHTPQSLEVKEKMHILYEEFRLSSTTRLRRDELDKEMSLLSKSLERPKDIEKINNNIKELLIKGLNNKDLPLEKNLNENFKKSIEKIQKLLPNKLNNEVEVKNILNSLKIKLENRNNLIKRAEKLFDSIDKNKEIAHKFDNVKFGKKSFQKKFNNEKEKFEMAKKELSKLGIRDREQLELVKENYNSLNLEYKKNDNVRKISLEDRIRKNKLELNNRSLNKVKDKYNHER